MKITASLCVSLFCSLLVTASAQIVVPPSSARTRAEAPGTMHTNIVFYRGSSQYRHTSETRSDRANIQGYHPLDIQKAYGMPTNGGSEAIAIVDGYDLPSNFTDFNNFSKQFGLPVETSSNPKSLTNKVFTLVYSNGSQPHFNSNGYGDEIALDMEWAHAVAPNAKIYLIETPTESLTDLMAGVNYAASLPDVREVSMSWGGDESQSQTQLDSNFTAANQAYFSAAGDQSSVTNWPATSPNVIGVGGTSLDFSAGHVVSEVVWNSAGGGLSSIYSRPNYQSPVLSVVGQRRGSPDICALADPNNGVAIFDSTADGIGQPSGWQVVGGTSLACPVCAAITNVRNAFSTSSVGELQRIYSLYSGSSYRAYFRDIVQGSSGSISATAGYDLVTGIGAPTGLITTTTFINPTALTATLGTPVQGVVDSVLVKDGHDLILRSAPSGGAQAAQLTGSFSVGSTSGKSFTASVTLVGMAVGASVGLNVFNQTTQTWDSVGTFTLGTSNSSSVINIPNLTNYLTSSGSMQFRITATGSSRFRLGIDQVLLAFQSL